MKKVIAVVVVLIAILLGAFYVTGVLTEKNLKQTIQAMHESNKLKVRVAKYRRGFFKSDVTLNVEIISPAKTIEKDGRKIFRPSNTYFMPVPLSIYHGPIILAGMTPKFGLGYADTQLTIPGRYIKHFNSKYTEDSSKPQLHLNIFVNFAANTSISLSTPEFQLVSTEKDSNFHWNGMQSDVDISRSLSDIRGTIEIDGLTWSQDKTLTVLQKVDSYFKLYKSDFDLFLGDSGVNIPAAIVSQGDKKLIELNNLEVKSNSYINKSLFNSSLQGSLDKLYIDQETYKNCSLDLYVRNLDAKTLIDVNNKIKRAQNGTERQRKQAIISVLPDLPVLLNKGAEVEISDFNMTMNDGSVKGSFILSLPNDSNKNPFYLIQKIRGSGHIEISKDLLSSILNDMYRKNNAQAALPAAATKPVDATQQADTETADKVTDPAELAKISSENKIAEMLNRGVIVADGANYVAEIRVVQGRLIVNDKPFSSDMLKL